MKKIKIAYITASDMSLRFLLLNQMKSLANLGYEVVGISSPGLYQSEIESAGIRHIPVKISRKFSPFLDLISLFSLYRLIKEEKFSIVHTHFAKPGLLGQLAARAGGVPIIVNTIHGFYFTPKTKWVKRKFYIFLEKIAANCSSLIFSVNIEDIQTALREGICTKNKMKITGPGGIGIDLSRFNKDIYSKDWIQLKRRELGLEDGIPVVGFVGRIVREKGIIDLFKAAQIVRKKIPSVKFLIIGPIEPEKSDAILPNETQKYGLSKTIIFTGMRQDMPEMYAVMDVFVLPSYREGFPRSPMEACAMGIPCVLTDIRGCREVVKNGKNGFLIPLGDFSALANAIIELLLDHNEANRMGLEGIRIAQECFDEKIVFQKVEAEYENLLKERGLSVAMDLC